MFFCILFFLFSLTKADNLTYLHEKPFRGLKKELPDPKQQESKEEKLIKIDALSSYIQQSPDLKLSVFCDENSVFSSSKNWECNNNDWKSDFDLLKVIKNKFTEDQLQRCQKQSAQIAQGELEEAEKSNYEIGKLISVAKKFPFTRASLEALILLGTLELEQGNSTVSALLMNLVLRRAEQFPSLFEGVVTSRTLFKAALAYSASEQRDSVNWVKEKALSLFQLKVSLNGKNLSLGKKSYGYEELEKEVNRKKEWVTRETIDWESPPLSFLYPEKKKEMLLKKGEGSLVQKINTDTELYNLLLLQGGTQLKEWTEEKLYEIAKVKGIEKEIKILPFKEYFFAEPCSETTFLRDGLINNSGKTEVISQLTENLSALDFSKDYVSDGDLRRLRKFKNLSSLNIEFSQVTDEGLVHLINFKNLSNLSLKNTTITDVGLNHLKSFSKLSSLNLRYTMITDEGLKSLAGIEALSSLNLESTQTKDKGLKVLAALPNLSYLNLGATQITDEGLKHFKEFKSLTSLNLGFLRIPYEGLSYLKEAKRLSSLVLDGHYITNTALRHLKEIPNLSSLSLRWTFVDDEGLEALKECKNLSTLELGGSPKITDKGLSHLSSLKKLSRLDLIGTSVTEKAILNFKKQHSNLKIVESSFPTE